ncbi:hypothetical protein BGZ95_011147 [Linnemannia exigua]|uniref:RecQ-mediated genome instability protein 1 n=1 Tax=Linnemannia exigua TaxID=604196 RepID=A0AAD4DK12_9FUNG|nr:hypothetical protein BGZ95_011147 [Linnemannia exigua]
MAFDDLLVRNDVQRMGVNASIDWIRQCIAYALSQGTPDSKLAFFILDMYLLADFRTLDPKALLPTATQTPHKQTLFIEGELKDSLSREKGGGAILQIIEIQDIGVSSLKMLEACDAVGVAGDEPGGLQVGKSLPQGNLSLDLTDGTRLIRAVLMEPILGIGMEMMLGAKIRVRNAEVRHGMLMLSSKNTFLLGGEVASMNEYPRRLVIMNQMKKRLGLPMDAIPGLNQNGANSTTAAPATWSQAGNNTASISNNNGNSTLTITTTTTTTTNNNNNNNINNNNMSTNIWKNPQPAVSAQDAVPSRTLSTPLTQPPTSSTPINTTNKDKDTPHNPWKSFQRDKSPSPLLAPQTYEDEYLQMQREQEPIWDHYEDMEFDNPEMRVDDGGWEVMSQLSMGGKGLTNSDAIKSKDSSPPLMATLSPSRRSSSTRRSISLRAPHSEDKEKEKERIRREWEVDRLPKNGTDSSSDNSNSRGRNGSGENAADGPSSPGASEFMTEYRQTLEHQKASLKDLTSRQGEPDYDDFDQDVGELDYNDPFQDHETLNGDADGPLDRKKRRTSPDSKNSPDGSHYPSRRRSQSFSASHWNEEETRVDIKMEPGTYGCLETPGDELVAIGKDGSRHGMVEDEERQEAVDARPASPPIRVKVEAAEARGVNHAVIDLSSDDDGDSGETSKSRASASQRAPLKQEPGVGTISGTNRKRAFDRWVPVKQEETLLEFEMDDEDDFGGLAEVVPIIPVVELTRVEQNVCRGQEIKAKARVHKLGKFSLTTQSASIPITLLPVDPVQAAETEGRASSDKNTFKLQAILEQRVVENLLQYSIGEFRSLVRINEAEARRAVKNLRATLLEVELVECQFKGLRCGIPVIRELTVLSKKRK